MLIFFQRDRILIVEIYIIIKFECVCGNEIETGSVVDGITVEICNKCHPFYTGQQKILDSEGRVERFNKRYGNK